MTISRQPKGVPVGGQFAPDARPEPEITLHGVPMAALEAGFKNVRRLQQEKLDQLTFDLATSSAAAIAARTKALYPTARYAVFHTYEERGFEIRPYGVLDSDRGELLRRDWRDTSGAYESWADGDGDGDPDSVYAMANCLEDHGGKLDGILSEITPGPGADCTVELDLDKALEIS